MELPDRTRRFSLLSACVFLIISPQAIGGIGRTPGIGSVSPDGEAIYSVPLSVPLGTNGMTPVLSLDYRHRTRSGLLGVGWSIGGLSQISRCQRTIAQDGIAIWPNHNSNDRYCLDGQRLVAMDVLAYGAPSGEYRTEIESFARVRAVSGGSSGPGHFVVEAADGRIYEYGATADSRIDRSAGATTANATVWALNRIRDRSGNVIDYRYHEDTANGSFRIASVRYNSNPGAGVPYSHQITSIYENRPSDEIDTGYVEGSPVRQIVRLDRIDILYNGSVLRRYDLEYEPALSAGGRSRLDSIRECAGSGGDCLAPTTFTWQNGSPAFTAPEAITAATPGSSSSQLSELIDINGDGRLDYVWPGGTTLSAATIRFRLRTANGFGPEVNSGISCPHGIGRPFDSDGDGRTDLLMMNAAREFVVVAGRDAGLAPPISTGVVAPAGLRDYRGLDFNGDGLGDIAWSESVGQTGFDELYVRGRTRSRFAGNPGYNGIQTLYSQQQSEARGGRFLGRPGDIDINGDGAEDLFMEEEFAMVGISLVSNVGFHFDGGNFQGGVVLDFNDDGQSDYAYKHPTGTLRVRIGGSLVELVGPVWNGAAALQAHDWNNDGRDDVLLKGATNWLMAISNGESLAVPVDSGVPHDSASTTTGQDVDGDGLQDLVTRVDDQVRVRLRKGGLPDLLAAASDGFGVSAEFKYASLTDATVYARASDAAYPDQSVQSPVQVVSRLTTTDGGGKGSKKSAAFQYQGLRRNLHGRGSLGFRKMTLTDLAAGRLLATEILRRQDFPYTGLPESIVVRQTSGKPVTRSSYQWSALSLQGRRYPYPATTTFRRHEMGGALDGAEIVRLMRSVAAIDATSGIVTDETTTVSEIAGGTNAGSSASLRTLRSGLLNDIVNWCLGRPQSIQRTASHTLAGGSPVTRHDNQSWDGLNCRPTQFRREPGDTKWEVIHDLTYDAFGNLASEKVTGAGMPARTVGIAWGSRGQLPVRLTNPLGQLIRMSWDEARGLPLSITDPNGLMTRWTYDVYDRPVQETEPDGTNTRWARDSCNSLCDARSKYRITQEDSDVGGTVRVKSIVEFDQNDRGFLLKSQRPGGAYAVATIERDDRGLIRRSHVPRWDGDSSLGYWAFTYDVLGRPTGAQLLSGGSTLRSMAIEYDGLAVKVHDPLARATLATRTAWGHLAERVDALGGVTSYDHDAFGNLLRVRDASNNAVATISYNVRGMKLTHADSDMGSWTWTRNALGETTVLRDAKGQILRFEYDPLSRITKHVAPEGTNTWTWGKSATNKNIGRPVKIAGPGYTESFTYDSVGRPASRTITTDASYRYDYAYNTLGLLDTLSYPAAGTGGALKIRHEYDAGRIARIRNANASDEPFWTLNAVDAAGNELDETLGDSVHVISGFDPVTGILDYRRSGALGTSAIQNLAYAWDASGNLTGRSDLNQNLTENFRYDALDRLVDSTRNGVLNLELEYDAIGNIRRKSDVCQGSEPCYSYHATRKHAVTSAGGQSFAYDANGNMTSRGGAAISWISGNLPASIARSNGNSSQFSYGPDGNRWKQVARYGSSTETTLHAGELLEKVARSGVTTWRHYILAPTGPVAVHLRYSDGSPPTTRYLTQDHLGSIDRIVGANGGVLASESFAPFGQRRGASWAGAPSAADLSKISAVTREGFTGHEHLDNLDLIHMNGRVYDPQLGRFISADPYVHSAYDGQALNRYSYTWNNPLSFTDPSGFDPPPCLESSPGVCAHITVIGVEWSDWIRYLGGGVAQAESAKERDPCGQDSDAFSCAMQGANLVSPARLVLTVGSTADPTLARSRLDFLQGAAARVANVTISSSPVAMLFGADPDFEWFDVPDSEDGRAGGRLGSLGYFLGGFGGMIRKGGLESIGSAGAFARSLQGKNLYPNIDRFKDIVLKKGTIIHALFPGKGYFYTTQSALRRVGGSSFALHSGLQIGIKKNRSPRMRIAAYEVVEDTNAAFGLAIANIDYGRGRLPQIVVPSFESSLRLLDDFPLGP